MFVNLKELLIILNNPTFEDPFETVLQSIKRKTEFSYYCVKKLEILVFRAFFISNKCVC